VPFVFCHMPSKREAQLRGGAAQHSEDARTAKGAARTWTVANAQLPTRSRRASAPIDIRECQRLTAVNELISTKNAVLPQLCSRRTVMATERAD
jgi:hypothetical protein